MAETEAQEQRPADLTRILAAVAIPQELRSCPCEGSLSFLHRSFRCYLPWVFSQTRGRLPQR